MHVYQQSPIDIPTNFNLTELLHTNARSPPLPSNHIIAKDDIEGRTLTIRQLRTRAGRLARSLVEKYAPRDQSRWAIVLPNSIALIETCHAVLWLGGVFCPINHLLTVHDMGHALAVCKAEYVVVFADVLEKVKEAVTISRSLHLGEQPRKSPEIIIGLGSATTTAGASTSISSLLASATTSLPVPHYADTRNRLASIHLSSGTTGPSKGVGLSHYNYIANVLQLFAHDPAHWTTREHVVSYTPFVHIANTTIPLFLGPWTGMRHLIMQKYEMHACLKLVDRERATSMQITPSLVVALAEDEDLAGKYDLISVKNMTVGGLPVTKALYERFLARGKGRWSTVQLYGMTEAAPYVAWQKVGEDIPYGAIGKLLPGMQARLCDDEGRDVDVGEKGELWIRGPNIARGYVDNPQATTKAFRDEDWYNTGDLCTIDSEGYLRVVGRTKELIKYNGFQVSPVDLEEYLNGHPAIAEASVAGTKSKKLMTELPTAYVVLKDNVRMKSTEGKTEVLKEIQRFVDARVSAYKKLRGGVWEVHSLPKNATGKVIRAQLGEYRTGLSSLTGSEKAKL
jgi:4-coumarate--CoA ligase